jgi:proteasome assembly chaperone (PAC2) family protein
VEEREPALLGQALGRPGDQLGANREVAKQATLLADVELGPVCELAGLTDVVQKGRRHQQIGVEPWMKLAHLADEGPDRDGVLEQSAQVGVMACTRARGAAKLRRHLARHKQPLHGFAKARVVDLASEVLQESLELLDRTVGGREELRGVERAGLEPPHVVELGDQVAAIALQPAAGKDRVAAREPQADPVRLAKDAGGQRSGTVTQLDHQVRAAVARRKAILPHAREALLEPLSRPQLADRGLSLLLPFDRDRRFHVSMVTRGPDVWRRGWVRLASTMDPITWEGDPPELRSPILVCAFAGWNDAASAATAALEAIAASHEAGIAARLDPEEFYDFQVNRPTIRLVEGEAREIDWPANTLLTVEVPSAERDLVLLSGVEPNVRWRTFADAIVGAAERLRVELVITLGSLIADVAHTHPVPITGLASDPDLVERLGLSRSNYEGPTGIVGVIHDACRRREITSASLWAAVPHYVAAVPNPKAALALLRRLEGLTGIAVEASELEDATDRFTEQVDRAVAANPEIEELVRNLEASQEEAEFDLGQNVPSGDDIAQEFQQFLRQRGKDKN